MGSGSSPSGSGKGAGGGKNNKGKDGGKANSNAKSKEPKQHNAPLGTRTVEKNSAQTKMVKKSEKSEKMKG